MPRSYRYVGPRGLPQGPPGRAIQSVTDVTSWIAETHQRPDAAGMYAATYIVAPDGLPRLADWRSEHVACAGGGEVLAAGELFLTIDGNTLRVEAISNLSTGYCPEPECWAALAAALDRIPLEHPGGFTQTVVYRRCEQCGQRNVVKDG